jgi:hypothetical protein
MRHQHATNICIYTRLSPQRLGQNIDLKTVKFHWLTESIDPHSLQPSLERIHHSISTMLPTDGGILWLDAVEYLISRQGFDSFLSFTRSLADEVTGTNWTIILSYTTLSLEDTQLAHLRREASIFAINKAEFPKIDRQESSDEKVVDIEEVTEVTENIQDDENIPIDVIEQQISGDIFMLSTIAEAALSPSVLARRIEQWESMGFDVSNLHFAKSLEIGKRYAIYRKTEELIRRAVECHRRIEMISLRGHSVEANKMKFRIFQLTGIDDVESRLEEIMNGQTD